MAGSYSRRRVLMAVGAAGTAATTGCLDWLTRSASDSHGLSVSEAESAHPASEFSAYVDRIRDQYGEHGVWGVRNENGAANGSTERLAFVGAWSDQWVLGSRDEGEIYVPIDVAAALYRVQTPDQGQERGQVIHRLWMWTAATPTQPDDGAGNTTLTTLSVGVELNSAVLGSYSPTTSIGPDDAPVEIGLDDDPPGPQARRRLPAGRIQPDPDETTEGKNGACVLNWSGGHGTTISVAGVCELRRQPDRDYDLTVTSDASASQGTL